LKVYIGFTWCLNPIIALMYIDVDI